ncbi:hypothetical protein [Streptomyces yatensis]|uniref:Uncharacterized protein n=1 Tax=Streptomyces yatensis TaxID=155177 RepID=A0ABN2GR43_9ACTN|nr:hypothetical protein [Streptomyces yatensis]
MRKGGYAALEAVGLVITALAAQTVIRGLLDRDSEVLWGILDWVPGGFTGRLILLGCIALLGTVAGGWAHTRQRPNTGSFGHSGRSHGRGKL